MKPPTTLEDEPAHWRQCAEDARCLADDTVDPIEKSTLFDIASSYEQLAVLAKLANPKVTRAE
jgi:hypothetical protein